MPYIPGVKLPYVPRTATGPSGATSRPRIFIGSHGGDNAVLGDNFNSLFGTQTSTLGGLEGSRGRVLASTADYGGVLDARRQARLAAADPGLSTRGRVGAPGRGARPVGGGLEGRGVRPSSGARMRPEPMPMYGPGRGELARIKRGQNAQRRTILGNLDANRARSGSGAGISRMEALAGKRMEQHGAASLRRQNVLANIERSKAGRTGGYRLANSPMLGPGRAEFNVAMGQRVRENIERSKAGRTGGYRKASRVPIGSAASGSSDAASKIATQAITEDKGRNVSKFLKGRNGMLLAGAGAIGLGAYLGGRERRGTSSGARGAYR